MFLASSLMILYPVMRERGLSLFCLNAPSWFWKATLSGDSMSTR